MQMQIERHRLANSWESLSAAATFRLLSRCGAVHLLVSPLESSSWPRAVRNHFFDQPAMDDPALTIAPDIYLSALRHLHTSPRLSGEFRERIFAYLLTICVIFAVQVLIRSRSEITGVHL